MSQIQERYRPVPMSANATETLPGAGLGGFICVTSGFLTVNSMSQAGTLVPVVVTFPVTAGLYAPLPMILLPGSTVVLSGGASGTLLKG